MPASRTAETLRPAQRGQIVATGPFAGEACLELEQVAWIILHEGAYYILGSPESSGYPIRANLYAKPFALHETAVELVLAVEEDVVPPDRADMGQ